jgi:branched-chain amino acid transport system permease protein
MVAALLAFVVVAFWWLDRTRLGYLKTAIGDDEFIVPVFGVPLVAVKLTIFALGGALGGLAGGLYAHYVVFIRPDDFGFALLIALQLPIVFGGLDRFYGAITGILLLGFVPEIVRGLDQYRLIFTAVATILILVFRPSGLVTYGTINRIKSFFQRMTGLARPANGV